MAEAVNHPPHYTAHPSRVEAIDVCEHLSFNVGNAVKYVWRARRKNADRVEDLKKAEWYLTREESRLVAPASLGVVLTELVTSLVGLLETPRVATTPDWHKPALRVIAQDELLLGQVLRELMRQHDQIDVVRHARALVRLELEK